jgi:hypothetical protein
MLSPFTRHHVEGGSLVEIFRCRRVTKWLLLYAWPRTNNPGTACTAQAHGSVLPWACGSRRAARSDACHIRGTALRDKVPSVQRVAQCRRRLRRPTEAQHALVPRFTGRAYRPPCGARSAAARTDAPTAIKLMLTKRLQAVARVSPTGDEHP